MSSNDTRDDRHDLLTNRRCSMLSLLTRFMHFARGRDRAQPSRRHKTSCHLLAERLEERCVPAAGVTEFGGLTANSFPFQIALGPDSNIWFAEASANKIGRLNLAS